MHEVIMATLSSTILLYGFNLYRAAWWRRGFTHVSSVVKAAKYSVSGLWKRIAAYTSLAMLTEHALHGMVSKRPGWMKVCLENARDPMHLHKTGQKHTEKPYLLSPPEFEMENGANR